MATREEIGLALDVIKMVNQMSKGIRASAAGMITNQGAKIQAIINDQAKQDKLVVGLTALDVTVSVLQTDKNSIVAACQHILDNVSEIVEV